MCLSINSGLNVNNLRLRHEWAMFSREISSLTQESGRKILCFQLITWISAAHAPIFRDVFPLIIHEVNNRLFSLQDKYISQPN